MARITRRKMLERVGNTTLAGAAAYFFSGELAHAKRSADDRLRVGCIGVGGRGLAVSKQAAVLGDVVAVCDVDLNHAEEAQAVLNPRADIYQDYRRVLERDDVDVIIQGTPDHWHTKINIEACRAGKDVYGEKPLTLTIEEGKQLRRVVQETGRVFQTGTMQRSELAFQTAVELVRNGRIGNLRQVWVALPHYSTKGGPFAQEPIPDSLDWDLYQGQAPAHPYAHQRCHKIFRWWYDYAGGIITDWGNHHIDIAHWGMDCDDTGPVSVDARGIFPNDGQADCFNTPDRFFSRMLYPNDIEILFFSALGDQRIYGEVEPCEPCTPEQVEWLFGIGDDVPDEIKSFDRNGIMFLGEEGRVFVNRGNVYGKPFEELAENPLPDDAWRVPKSNDHMANFFDCVRTREKPVAPVEVEHRTVTACHLTNLSVRLGRKLQWDPVAEEIVGDPEAVAMQGRKQRDPYGITLS